LWLSRSWTTRARRPGEAEDAYTWVTKDEFEARIAQSGFLEWAEFLGELYGTPVPHAPAGMDVVLEIDLQGAEQIRARYPDAEIVLVIPPSRAEQEARLRHRGDTEDRIRQRLELAEVEEARGRALADHTVVNDDLSRAVAEVAGIIEGRRTAPPGDQQRETR